MIGLSHVSYAQVTMPKLAPESESDPVTEDVVLVRELSANTKIGAYADERAVAQTVYFDLDIGATRQAAGLTDRLSDTIDYARVVEAIREICARHRHHLLEALAEEITAAILRRFEATWVRLTVVKGAVIPGTRFVGVSISRRRRG